LAVLIGMLVWKQWAVRRKTSRIEITAGIFAIALTVSVALTGHAAATGGMEFWFRVGADALHLFITAIWPTGLLPFALFLAFAHRAGDAVQQPTLRVIHRFSNVSFAAVWVLVASGISLACFMLGSFQALFATDYGRLLSLKIFLFLIMLGIASWNRYRLVPQLGSETRDENSTGTHLRRLQGFVLVELTLAVAIVIVVSFLGATPPRQ
jgi:putative copper resistance protein D